VASTDALPDEAATGAACRDYMRTDDSGRCCAIMQVGCISAALRAVLPLELARARSKSDPIPACAPPSAPLPRHP